MLKRIRSFALLAGSLMLMNGILTGCSIEFVTNPSETTTEGLSLITEASTEENDTGNQNYLVNSGDNGDDNNVSINLGTDTGWSNYEITTNEIDYDPSEEYLDEDGYYTTELDVATYIVEYQTLPENFITKKEAKKLGWTGGSLDPYGEDMCIGGDHFGNYEGVLPEVEGREYFECDIDTMNKKKRGSKRIVYSNDGQIYYTDDHYETFTLIYGTDE